ncbi:MAG: HK97 family phage prohead protease [Planctomycetota bacterium]|nr:HK97 family phage prohead protease [Planctomycetota bacterium]
MATMKWLEMPVKGFDPETGMVTAWASTEEVDGVGDVILAKAWKDSLKEWKKRGSRPKFLAYHSHWLADGHSPVIGGFEKMEIVLDETPKGLTFKAWFADTELGREHKELYGSGAMDAFSVGFAVMEAVWDPKDIAKVLKKNKLDYDPVNVGCVITKAHLMEVSAVVLGCNMGALVKASDDGNEFAIKSLSRLSDEFGIKPDQDGKASSDVPEIAEMVGKEEKAENVVFTFDEKADDVLSLGPIDIKTEEPEEIEEEAEPEPEIEVKAEPEPEATVNDVLDQMVKTLQAIEAASQETTKTIKTLADGVGEALSKRSSPKARVKAGAMDIILNDLASTTSRFRKPKTERT